MVLSEIGKDGFLTNEAIHDFVAKAAATMPVDDKSVLFIIPDQTRSMPMPQMFRALYDALHDRVAKMDYLIALGTHPPMIDEMIQKLLGVSAEELSSKYGDVGIFNHEWQNPDALAEIGEITADEIESISGGLMRQSVKVTVNKRVLDYDLVCIVGPVFPHEVVGFSGGNKYFYPGVSGAEILNLFHWLGALITNYSINGTKHTPVREVVNRAASFIKVEKRCFALTVVGKQTKAAFFGSPEEAWSEAADLSSQTHIVYKKKAVQKHSGHGAAHVRRSMGCRQVHV